MSMEKPIYKNSFYEASFDDSTGIFRSRYLPGTSKMKDSEWKELQTEISRLFFRYSPSIIIDNNLDRNYDYPPDIQEWTLKLHLDLWNKMGLRKYVQVAPSTIIGKLTSDQIFELALSSFPLNFEHKIVAAQEEAETWIKE